MEIETNKLDLEKHLTNIGKLLKAMAIKVQLYDNGLDNKSQSDSHNDISNSDIEKLKDKIIEMCHSVDEANSWIKKISNLTTEQIEEAAGYYLHNQKTKTNGRKKYKRKINKEDLIDSNMENNKEAIQDKDKAAIHLNTHNDEEKTNTSLYIDMTYDKYKANSTDEGNAGKSNVIKNTNIKNNITSDENKRPKNCRKRSKIYHGSTTSLHNDMKTCNIKELVNKFFADNNIIAKLKNINKKVHKWMNSVPKNASLDQNDVAFKIYELMSIEKVNVDEVLLYYCTNSKISAV